jgi:GT2 family glycosyltransferase
LGILQELARAVPTYTSYKYQYIMPSISVIIACVNGLPWINQCLSALEKQRGKIQSEVLVLNCCDDGTSEHITEKFPMVRLFDFPQRLSIPELRAIGMSHATGDIIAITEDHCIPADNWFEEILRAHASDYSAVGGTVVNGSVDRIIDWAVYLCEYSHVMPPIPSGEVDGIAGNNATYKKEILDKVDESVKKNYWEFFLHEELRKTGIEFLSVPAIVVSHKKEFGFLYFLTQRFHYSRSFTAMRRTRVSFPKRLLYIFSSPCLPALLLWRITQQVLRKKKHQKEFLLSFPFLSIFMVSYAFGELVGYLFGDGNSLLKVE